MNQPRPTASTPDENALFAYGDDPNAAPANDLEATVRRIQRATGLDTAISSSIPTDLKHQIWEDLMHGQSASTNPNTRVTPHAFRRVAELVSARPPTESSPPSHHSRFVRTVVRWQPAVSLAVVIAFLVGLVGIAYQRGVLNEPGAPAPQAGSSQIAPGPQDFPETPEASTECVPHGADRLTTDELGSMSLSDWPLRSYVPPRTVDPAIGQAALDTFLGWNACRISFTPTEGTPAPYPSDDVLSYYSDRWQFLTLSSNADQVHREAFGDYWDQDIADELVGGFPLPLNRPNVVFEYGTYPTGGFIIAFSPGDVFQLPDGRYGVVTGTVSTEALRTGPANDYEGWLQFIAFLDVDGTLLIDEMFPICVAGTDGTASLGIPALFPIAAAQAGQPPANQCS